MNDLDKAKKDLYNLLNGLIPQENIAFGEQIAIPAAIGAVITAARTEAYKEQMAMWAVIHQVENILHWEKIITNNKKDLVELLEHLNKIKKK